MGQCKYIGDACIEYIIFSIYNVYIETKFENFLAFLVCVFRTVDCCSEHNMYSIQCVY